MEMAQTVSDLVVDWLVKKRITTGFGVPGGGLAKIYSVMCNDDRLNMNLCQHECGAAYMAMGFNMSSQTGQRAFCFSTGGPGATNLVTGICAADSEGIPLLAITGNVASELFGRGASQDSSRDGLDIEAIFGVCTARSQICLRGTDVLAILDDLWSTSLVQQRPVHFNLPINVSMEEIKPAHYSIQTEVGLL